MPKQPVIFISHGGGPCFWMQQPAQFSQGIDILRAYLADLLNRLPARPSAIVLVTAHWETPSVTVSTASAPSMLFDYYGFPEHTYRLSYPAPGAPELADKVRSLLNAAGLANAQDGQRGFDHGVFVPMLIIDPDAHIPVLMMSIEQNFDPARHIAIGQALRSVRDDNVLILGSGNTFHNLRSYGVPGAADEFDAWLQSAATETDPQVRATLLTNWSRAPGARFSHPREEHLLPLMVIAGAAGSDPGRVDYHGSLYGKPASGFVYG